jgi:hypothetical protein
MPKSVPRGGGTPVFKVEYVESADPLVAILRSEPHTVFGRPYAGYIIFLFGNTDSEVCSWIRDQLITLDSLTGPEIAGVVFAKRVAIKARVFRQDSRHPSPMKNPWRWHNRHSRRWFFGFRSRPMIRRDREDLLAEEMHGSYAELQATTYAADEIAKALDVVSDLPCLIVADAVPTPQLEVYRLTNSTLGDVVPLLRSTVGHFTPTAKARGLLPRLRMIEDLSKASESLKWEIRKAETEWSSRVEMVDLYQSERVKKARQYLCDGSARGFEKEIKSVRYVDPASRQKVALLCQQNSKELCQYSKTIGNISWYLNRNWPLDADAQRKLEFILANYAMPLLDIEVMVDGKSRGSLGLLLVRLRQAHEQLVTALWGDLPTPEEVDRLNKSEVDTLKSTGETAVKVLGEELRRLNSQIEDEIATVLKDPPSLQQSFRTALRERKINGLKRALTHGALELLTGFLTPDIRPLFARDVYVGVNVGAMGPQAVATNTTFGASSTLNSNTAMPTVRSLEDE